MTKSKGADEPATPTTAEARAVGITGSRGWPYGPNIDHQARRELVDWATQHRLRYSRTGRCLDWLRTGRCPRDHIHSRGGWADHVTGWTRDGQPAVLVAQPYGISGDSLTDLAELDRSGLDVRINGTGWYGHGTTFITIWRDRPEPRQA